MGEPLKESGILPKDTTIQRPKWFLDCEEHGRQEAVPESIQQWGEETEQTLRDIGQLKENEHFCTGNCPICGTTKQTFSIGLEDKNPTSEHKNLTP